MLEIYNDLISSLNPEQLIAFKSFIKFAFYYYIIRVILLFLCHFFKSFGFYTGHGYKVLIENFRRIFKI